MTGGNGNKSNYNNARSYYDFADLGSYTFDRVPSLLIFYPGSISNQEATTTSGPYQYVSGFSSSTSRPGSGSLYAPKMKRRIAIASNLLYMYDISNYTTKPTVDHVTGNAYGSGYNVYRLSFTNNLINLSYSTGGISGGGTIYGNVYGYFSADFRTIYFFGFIYSNNNTHDKTSTITVTSPNSIAVLY